MEVESDDQFAIGPASEGVGDAVGVGSVGAGGGLFEVSAEIVVIVEFPIDDGVDAARRGMEGLSAGGGEIVD